MSKKNSTFDERLKDHPRLRARFEAILDVAEGTSEGPDTADAVEERTIQEVRKLGQEVMEEWGTSKATKEVNKHQRSHPKAQRHKKKRCIGTRLLGKSM